MHKCHGKTARLQCCHPQCARGQRKASRLITETQRRQAFTAALSEANERYSDSFRRLGE